MSALDVSRDVGVEVYECNFEPADLHDPLDDIEMAPARPAKSYDPLDELGVPRDQWGRPLLLPDPAWGLAPTTWPDGKIEKRQMADGRRHFARVSTAAGWNDVAHGLTLWRQRMALLALARRPDLQAELAGLVYSDGKRIDAITDELLIRAADDGIDIDEAIKVKPGETHVPMGGTLSAPNRGTAWHALTVPGAPVIDPTFGPTLMQYEVTARAFDEALERCGLELLVHERFGVDYARRLAGTVDHLARVIKETTFSAAGGLDVGSVICCDKKTGKHQWITHATQLAMYSRCRSHNWRTGETQDWHPDLVPDVGAIAAASIETGKVKIYPVKTPTHLADSAVERYRLSLSEHVNGLVGKGF
jgi:hypothetical protein